jgi:hypothetical protein
MRCLFEQARHNSGTTGLKGRQWDKLSIRHSATIRVGARVVEHWLPMLSTTERTGVGDGIVSGRRSASSRWYGVLCVRFQMEDDVFI